MSDVNDRLEATAKQLGQRLLLIAAMPVAMISFGSVMSSNKSGTFSSTSKATNSAMMSDDLPDDDNGWGSSTKGKRSSADEARVRAAAARKQRAYDSNGERTRDEIKVYDAHEDGGWGN
jgi:hypothetical protein